MQVNWYRLSPWSAESDAGYRIAMSTGPQGDRYLAYGPAQPGSARKGTGWAADLCERYAIGERIPQARELIGCTDTPAAARNMCEQHQEECHAA